MKILSHKRVVAAALVAAVLGVIAALGAISKSTPAAAPTISLPTAPGQVPYAAWYWSLAVSPKDPKTLVLGTSNGLLRSSDAGRTWTPTGPAGVIVTSVIDVGDTTFAGGVSGASPNIPWVRRSASARVAPDGGAVLAESSDGGSSWQELHPAGLPNVSVQALAVVPGSTTLYALLNTGALYRSTDGAHSFQIASSNLGVVPWALAMTRDHIIAGDMDTGSRFSTNGKSWRQAPFTDSQGGRMVMEYAVEPNAQSRVLMTSRGVQMSTDGGRSWHFVIRSQVMFGPVAWVPTKPEAAYVVGSDRSVWRSTDGGKRWAQLH